MRTRERLLCAAGSIFNDLCRRLFSFCLVFFMEVMELSAPDTGLIIFVGLIADALASTISGYLGDMVKVPFLSQRIGRRKSWHLLATVFMGVTIPLCVNRCFLCSGSQETWLPIVYYSFLFSMYNMCFSVVEINHLALMTTAAVSAEERTDLSAMRTVFGFLSGIYIYVIAWGLFRQDNSDGLGAHSLHDFVYLSWIATGTGLFFAAIFHIGTKEPKICQRKASTISDLMNAPGIFTRAFGPKDANSRHTNLAFKFIDMFMASAEYEEHQKERNGCGDTQSDDLRSRKQSLLQKFVAAILSDGETGTRGRNHDQPRSATEETTRNPESEETKARVILEIQHLDREHKKSLLMRVFDSILLRLQRKEHEQPKNFGVIEDQVTMEGKVDYYATDERFWNARQEEIRETAGKDIWKMTNSVEVGSEGSEGEDQNEDLPKTSFCTVFNQRKRGIVLFPDAGKCGLSNSGFEDNGGDDDKKESLSSKSVNKQKPSVTFDPSEFLEILSMNRTERQGLNLDHTPENKTSPFESIQDYPKHHCRERIEVCESRNNSSTSGDNPGLPGLVQSTNAPSERRRQKGIKNWLRDPNLYMVAIIFTCSRLAQDSVSIYLPLFLTERLIFSKEATAYFPIILLTSGSLASSFCNKLNRKIGSKWSYLLASLLVMGGAVWCYFQTFSTKQSTYAPVVMIGSGLSIMYVMALVFITELIGENKETSGSVFSIITVIARISSGGLIIGIQEFYPKERTRLNEAVSNYVHHVFVMAPGILTLLGSLLVLFFQPSKSSYKSKASQDVEALHGQSSFDAQVVQCPSEVKARPNFSSDDSHNTSIMMVDNCSEHKKLS